MQNTNFPRETTKKMKSPITRITICLALLAVYFPVNAGPLLDFSFSFSDSGGTVSGRILGLMDDTSNQAAQQVIIDSYPTPPFSNVGGAFGGEATSWSTVGLNDFSVLGGTITQMGFYAAEGNHKFWLFTAPFFPPDDLNALYQLEQDNSGDGCLDLPCDYVRSIDSIVVSSANVPEPGVLGLLSLGLMGLGMTKIRKSLRRSA